MTCGLCRRAGAAYARPGGERAGCAGPSRAARGLRVSRARAPGRVGVGVGVGVGLSDWRLCAGRRICLSAEPRRA